VLCRLLRASTACILLSGALLGQSAQDAPTFRSGVEYVEVDVLVTDRQGRLVRDLTPEDFTLLDSGQPRPILSFSLVDIPLEPAAQRRAALDGAESDVTTNVGLGRTFVLAINTGGTRVRDLVRQFVEDVVGPNDQVAILRVYAHPSQAQGFTRSRALMLHSIDRLLLTRPGEPFDPTRLDPADRPPVQSGRPDPGYDFRVIQGLAEQLGQISGRRKAIIWIDPPAVFHGGPDPALRLAQRDALRAASRNNVALYVVSSRGLPPAQQMLGSQNALPSQTSLNYVSGLRLLAEETGGDAIVSSNNFTGGFERFARDNSTYYLLGYEPAAHRDGAFHPLTVRVNRPGVTVRARTGYYALDPAPIATSAATSVGTAARLSDDTLKALRMPLSSGTLGIDVTATPFKGTGLDGSVLVGALVRGDGLVRGAESRVEVALQVSTIEKAIEPGTFKVFTVSPSAVGPAGLLFFERLTLPRGRYQIRVAVHQSEGKTGNTVVDVEVPKYAAPLVLSGVALGTQPSAGPRVLQGDAPLQASLSNNPTLTRRFLRTDVVTAFVEAYTDTRVSPGSPQLTARLAPTGKGRPTPIELFVQPHEPGRTGYLGRMPLRDLVSGDYVLTFEARIGKETANRQILLTVLDTE